MLFGGTPLAREVESESKYKDSGKPAFTTRFAAFIRSEGGCGTKGDDIADPPKMPDRAPDHETSYATRADWAATLARLGVTPARAVVLYDAQGGMYAARAWWMLLWARHRAVSVLDELRAQRQLMYRNATRILRGRIESDSRSRSAPVSPSCSREAAPVPTPSMVVSST